MGEALMATNPRREERHEGAGREEGWAGVNSGAAHSVVVYTLSCLRAWA